jgi:hypothetical protein
MIQEQNSRKEGKRVNKKNKEKTPLKLKKFFLE